MIQLSSWQSGANTKGGTIDFYVNSISNYPSSRIVHTMTDGTGGELQFHTTNQYVTTAPTAKMVITDDGNVGIGTTNPQATLDVNGTIRGATYGFGGIYRPTINLNPFTGTYSCPSGFSDFDSGIGSPNLHICYK